MRFSESAATVCPAKYCSATGKDFCKTSETPVHPEQLKKKSPFQREEPDGREENHSCGQHMSSDDQADRLHNHLVAADKCINPHWKSTRRTSFHISEFWIWAMAIITAIFAQKSWRSLGRKAGLTSSVGLFQGCQVWSLFLFQHPPDSEKFSFKSKSPFSALLISLNGILKSWAGGAWNQQPTKL